MLLSSIIRPLALGLLSFILVEAEPIVTKTPAVAERQIISSVAVSSVCATGTSGVVAPLPSGAVCGVAATSNGGVLMVSYTSGANVASISACGKICLATAGCTNLYFTLNAYCNLHSGAETHVLNGNTAYRFYDATCFSCSPLTTVTSSTTTKPPAATPCTTNALGLATPQPSGAVCNVKATSNGGTLMISYTSGIYTFSITQCSQICLATTGCTNLYYEEGSYCNLHSGAETHVANPSAIYSFYDATCFICPAISSSTSHTTTVSTKVSSSSKTTTSTSIKNTSSTKATSILTSSSSTPTQTPWTSIQTNPALYNMAITTTFTQPPQCTGASITQMAWWGTNLWENAINPIATSTITTCYPSQFYSSVMGALNSVPLPAFSALVCPQGWTASMYNSTYGVCCPTGFGINAPYYVNNTDRPFSGAACTSTIGAGQLYDITSYNSSAYWTDIPTSAPADGTFVRVNAFDGIIKTISASTTSSSTSSCTPASTVAVTFQVPYAVSAEDDGEYVNLVGSTDSLGSWAANNSINMSAELYSLWNPLWETTVDFAAGTHVQYKYLHYFANGTYNATSNPNYTITVPTGCSKTTTVLDVWR